MRRLVAAVVAILAMGGCLSATTLTGARAVKPGEMEIVVSPQIARFPDEFGGLGDGTWEGDTVVAPFLELRVRVGLAEGVDLGLAWEAMTLGTNVKIELHRSALPESGIDLALMPGIAAFPTMHGAGGILSLPLLFGVNLGPHQLVLAPRAAFGSSRGMQSFMVGSSLGYRGRVSEGFALIPEISLLQPVAFTTYARDNNFVGGWRFSLGFQFSSAD